MRSWPSQPRLRLSPLFSACVAHYLCCTASRHRCLRNLLHVMLCWNCRCMPPLSSRRAIFAHPRNMFSAPLFVHKTCAMQVGHGRNVRHGGRVAASGFESASEQRKSAAQTEDGTMWAVKMKKEEKKAKEAKRKKKRHAKSERRQLSKSSWWRAGQDVVWRQNQRQHRAAYVKTLGQHYLTARGIRHGLRRTQALPAYQA